MKKVLLILAGVSIIVTMGLSSCKKCVECKDKNGDVQEHECFDHYDKAEAYKKNMEYDNRDHEWSCDYIDN